jgi:hypothetical protein
MKEINLLESWADSVIANEAVQDRPLARDQDIQYQASRKYSDRSPEQALQMFVADKLQSSEKMDYEQNKLINSQKRENEKLRRTLSDLGQELTDHEKQAAQTDQEVARLKDLSSKLKPAGEIQQATAKASAEKLEAMVGDVEKLRNMPGMDEQKYKELANKVNNIKAGAGDEEVQKVQTVLASLSQRQAMDDQLFDKVMSRLDDTQQKLDSKEKRFRAYIGKKGEEIGAQTRTHGEELKKYAGIVDKYKTDVESFRSYMDSAKQEVAKTKEEVDALKQDAAAKMQELDLLAPMLRKAAVQSGRKPPTAGPDMDAERAFQQAQSSVSDIQQKSKRKGADLSKLVPDSEKQRSYGMQALNPDELNEDLRQYEDPEFYDWATKNMPVIEKMFFNRYPELQKSYEGEEVLEVIEDYIPYLYQYDEIEMPLMNKFLDVVKNRLKTQQRKQVQRNLFNDLNEQFEDSLDKLIGLDYIKTRK